MNDFRYNVRKLVRRFAEPVAYNLDASFVRPSNVSLSLTNRCNLRCPTCSYWHTPAEERANELTLDEIKALLGKLRAWLGPFLIGITGGEPFLRPDALDIVRECARLGIRVGTVTNGSMFTGARLEALQSVLAAPDNPFEVISISLNHLDPEKHDVTRGVTNSAEKIFEALDALNVPDRTFRLTISTILMGHNLDAVGDIVRWVKAKGLDAVTFQPYYFESGNADYKEGWQAENRFWDDDPEKIDRAIDCLIAMKRDKFPITNSPEQLTWMREYLKHPDRTIPIPCKVGVANLSIEPNGDVQLCDVMTPVGNVRRQDPAAIWAGAMAKERRQEIRTCGQACRIKTCNFRKPLLRIARERFFGG